ncbi:MAG: hypothetical protein IKH57_15870 [Clostridia bacterium]|nr:hypothetical protein [Clostridia bacterium]
MLLMFAVAGGAMTAAAGELAALMLPVFHGRAMGQILTLGAGIAISRKSVRALGMIGKILIPLMLLAFFFCFRASTESNHDTCVSAPPFGIALFQLLGYCGLNVTLSAGVIHEAGLLCKDDRKLTVYSSIALGVLLIAGNAAMLPHASWLENVPLPIVMLLRKYGKAGFYLSAFVLYLAVFSTFVAILRAMRGLFPENIRLSGAWIGLLCAAFSLFGFERLVQYAYSALGWIGVLLILWKKFRKNGTKRKSVSSIGRTLMKEEITE